MLCVLLEVYPSCMQIVKLNTLVITYSAEQMYWMIDEKRKEGEVIFTLNEDGNSYRESNELSCR